MGCASSSSHKAKKPEIANTNEKKEPDNKTIENGKHDDKTPKSAIVNEQGLRSATDQNMNIAYLKDSQSVPKVTVHRQNNHKEQANGVDVHGHPKSSTKETTQGVGNPVAGVNQQSKQEDLGRILDDELLKELEKDVNKSQDKKSYVPDQDIISYRIDKDSLAIDFDELKGQSPFFGAIGFFDPRKENIVEGGDEKSLTLNLTDLKIEQHQ